MSEPVPPQDFTDDTLIWPIMVRLQECLCTTLTERGLMPGDCFCGLMPGNDPSWDYEDGMAWVRLVNAYPSTTFPTIDTTPRGSCAAEIAATIEVAVLQCAPTLSVTGVLPSEFDMFEPTRLQLATMKAMKDAIMCCGFDNIVLGQYQPLGPQGGLVGGFWTVDVTGDD